MPDKDLAIQQAIESVIGKSRKGRSKIIHLVQKNDPTLGASRIRRVYQRTGFSLYKRYSKRKLKVKSNPIVEATMKNQEWAIDFMSDTLANGRKIRTLNVIDHYGRKCLSIVLSYNFPARKVIEILERTIEKYGKPIAIRTDNGPEFTSRYFQNWLFGNQIQWSQIEKGKPSQNGIIERFNRTYREDILDPNILYSLEYGQSLTDDWIEEYNTVRPHETLNYKTPNEYAA